MEIIEKYFPELTERQKKQFAALYDLYIGWNSKINLISRKDIENLYGKHVLHSLGIAKVIRFAGQSAVLDVGTGGGFPGIPLAILFPKVRFLLIDGVGKKIKAAKDIAEQIDLENIECKQGRVEEEKAQFDFVVSRAAMPLSDLLKTARKNIVKDRKNAIPNGFLCLKGGNLQAELKPFKNKVVVYELTDYFSEEFFRTKKVIYLPA
ncbi:MAG: 16S rRNA (guanine(527)-N(7))-methyltransferase RsmG [Dysgonamonadaceae bacterium]|jgi:16S rRNA (guanine527-N7)-methyltransferase|nr:16S rRNA (guanine(527)-N(7))-methyltransferase RsmG [Dysgonamonadaceae bacterium]